jgi:mycothiol synthase
MSLVTTMRPYRDDDDYWRMRRFLQRAWQAPGAVTGLYHIGDLTWQRFMYPPDVFPPGERIALWERPDGELTGFAWYDTKSVEVALQIDPALRTGGDAWAIADEMLAWAEGRRAADPGAGERALTVAEFGVDTAFAAYIASRGFVATDEPALIRNVQSLDATVPEPDIPEGFAVRPVLPSDAEIEQRVAIHREVWAPSRVTLEGYRQLRAAPGYDPELDLVAVAPDGTLAAYTIVWYDEVNRSGLFEPVGAREAFRGRGLTKAVMREGLRRLRARGGVLAYVCVEEDNLAARALYRSAGFAPEHGWVRYRSPAHG